MKIAFLTPEFPHEKTGTSGGIGTSIKNLADGLIELGHKPLILVYGQSKDAIFQDKSLTVYQIKNVKFKGLSWYLTRKKIEKLINALHREQKLDVVEAPDWTGISSFIRPNCPLTVRLNGSDTYFCHLDKRPVKWFNRFHERRALKNADALLSVSEFTANLTNKLFGLSRQFEIIPNSIDAKSFNSSAPTTSNTVLYFGTLIRKKGALELPHIFNELHRLNPSAKLVLVGRDSGDIFSGQDSTWALMKPLFSDKARANVDYRGGVPYTEIRKIIDEAAVCVFPTFAEALPVSWIEAMAMGKAVVASNIGWAEEVIKDGKSGFLEHPANHVQFARKVAMLLSDAALRETIGRDARERVLEKFDIAVVARQNSDFYQRLTKQNR